MNFKHAIAALELRLSNTYRLAKKGGREACPKRVAEINEEIAVLKKLSK